MKASHYAISLTLLGLLFFSCNNTQPESRAIPEPIGGRDPEAVLWVSGDTWFPATVGLTFYGGTADGNSTIIFRAASRADRGFKREVGLNLTRADISWPPSDTLNLLTNEHPDRVSVRYEVYRNNSNSESDFWVGERPDLGGIKIYSLTEEDGVVYAAGEVSMTVLRDDLTPSAHVITSLFNNVRVFDDVSKMFDYFERVNTLLAATD